MVVTWKSRELKNEKGRKEREEAQEGKKDEGDAEEGTARGSIQPDRKVAIADVQRQIVAVRSGETVPMNSP